MAYLLKDNQRDSAPKQELYLPKEKLYLPKDESNESLRANDIELDIARRKYQ